MKFAPGRGNMKLLIIHSDGADVWDAKLVSTNIGVFLLFPNFCTFFLYLRKKKISFFVIVKRKKMSFGDVIVSKIKNSRTQKKEHNYYVQNFNDMCV